MSAEEKHFLELLGKHLEGTLSPDEREALLALVDADPDKAFLLAYLGGKREEGSDQLEAEIVYEKTFPNDLRTRIQAQRDVVSPIRTSLKSKYISIAASIIFLFGLLLGIKTYYAVVEKGKEWEHISAEKGERKFLRMSDGTEIWLNSESSLQVKKGYGIKHREIILQGEAYFSVAKNEELPLHVSALDANIEVLGTVFNVRAYPDEQKTTTSLITGKVKLCVDVESGKRDYILNPGDKVEIPNRYAVIYNETTPFERAFLSAGIIEDAIEYKRIATESDRAVDFLWIENKLVFNGDPLEHMVKKMERWYNRTIVIENESLKEEHFTGVFEERTCEQVLDLLQKTGVNFTYKVENGVIYIK